MEHIERSRDFTIDTLMSLRAELEQALRTSPEKDKLTIVATGSYGREEASQESDIDLFILFDADDSAEDRIRAELKSVEDVIKAKVPHMAGDTGTFGLDAVKSFSEMKINIGGQHDDNLSLTRRMLFLLEGTWLYQETRFKEYQSSLLRRYVENSSPKAALPRFLLNDIIRYYRTITTDFEHKISESGKAWGLRNIKLRFSRKLLYFGGILVVAEMAEAGYDKWEPRALELFSIPVLRRIEHLIKDGCGEKVLMIYDRFIAGITDKATREALSRVTKEDRTGSTEYQGLRVLSDEFSAALSECLKSRYKPEHPIHHALMF
ncbi:nucleotidyltransferase domain-containing protein [Isoalcanivorax pacificus]|nr:nucleotidyltransferase domain-containing protein [Isoalcanivorax pacificus]